MANSAAAKRKPRRNPSIGFRADERTLRAIDKLEAAVGEGVPNAKSVAIRRAIIGAADALDGSDKAK